MSMSSLPLAFKAGTYVLFNNAHGAALTLSPDDHRTISGADFNPDGSPFQLWTFVPTESPSRFLIKSAAKSPQGKTLYLVFDKRVKGWREGSAVVATALYPVTWEIVVAKATRFMKAGIRITFPTSGCMVTLFSTGVKLERPDDRDVWLHSSPALLDEDMEFFFGLHHWVYSPYCLEGSDNQPTERIVVEAARHEQK